MTKFSDISEVQKIAQLAMLELKEDEAEALQKKFSSIRSYFDSLADIPVSDNEDISPIGEYKPLREDIPCKSGIRPDSFSAMTDNSSFTVPKFNPVPADRWVMTVGNFDGLHRGHLHLIDQMKQYAVQTNSGTVLLSFTPHPKEILNPHTPLPKIYSLQQKIDLCREAGIDRLTLVEFTEKFAQITPEDFIAQYIVGDKILVKLYIGFDFNFGKNRSGTAETVRAALAAKGIPTEQVSAYKIDRMTVSSSMIRRLLFEGEFEQSALYLGRDWLIEGVVVGGRRQGRQLGFPTANLIPDIYLPLRAGVYATRIHLEDRKLPAVTNIGVRPTLTDDPQTVIESHIFNFSEDIYGKKISVQPVRFIRPEQKFSGVEELKSQIALDLRTAQSRLI
ncbi:hypothetical protein CHS0354_035278 [Potamilus streckersoni]|uniref:Bifunctional riboflavin kinase/FMN adenylyltransferase n=1 Tax=Potamilus streckersoni TaxID=2493646 RepID=A0AAE0S2H4_9BIVA|nr:hypothetical protein CHS0354_035278 [Potamilus streckersoni]